MIGQFLLEKIASNPTDFAWSQSYSTLNLYLVLEVHGGEHVTQLGKKLLERIQREYFALDEKTLNSIKQAITNSLEEITAPIQCSIVLVTIIQDICYIVIANGGRIYLKRGKDLAEIAKGIENQVLSFSGKLTHHDIIIVQTEDFSKKISMTDISQGLVTGEISDLAEQIAPTVHTNATGSEAAIFIQYLSHPNHSAQQEAPIIHEPLSEVEEKEETEEEIPEASEEQQPKRRLPKVSFSLPKNLTLQKPNKKILFAAVLVILVGTLLVALYNERKEQSQNLAKQQAEELLPPLIQKIEEAEALSSVNKGIALKTFQAVREELVKHQSSFPSDSPEYEKFTTYIQRVDQQLEALAGNVPVKNKKEVFSTSSHKEFSEIGGITAKSGILMVVDSEKGIVYNSDSSELQESSLTMPLSITADESYSYIASSSKVARIDKQSGKAEEGEHTIAIAALETFNGNLYLLDSKSSDIIKKPTVSSSGASYFKGEAPKNIVAFSIDSSIWVVMNGGELAKYTKGEKDPVPFSGMPDGISNDLQLYTEEGFANLYLLDKTSKKLLVIKKNGQYQNQYNLSEFDTVVSVALVESTNTGFVATPTHVYSFEL